MQKIKNIIPILMFLLLVFVFLASSAIKINAKTIVAGYYPSWNKTTLPAEKLAIDDLTHVFHTFAWPEPDGRISTYGDFIYPRLNEKV